MYISVVQFNVNQTLVGVHNLLHRNALITMEYERRLRIVILKDLTIVILGHSLSSTSIYACKNTTCEISTERNEIHNRCLGTDSTEILLDLGKMLMSKKLIY